ncbi:TRAP transporter small permease [Petroclostridium sp. X23]|uniref:TRAP transporter small permease n=1 Tax=Petroclostridium sp. X23 TaxID=3045146 RepID=UPI0024AD5158|nr:TRAP transporter small permease [Petroclostridium sp. X23]WHH57836.1 TRAP transporter small permease [Petroclostridium sp. X23]
MKKKLLFEEHLIAAMMIIMLLILGVNVIGRYVVGASLAFTEELVNYLFVCASLLGAPAACARGANMGLSAITDLCPPKTQKFFMVIASIASILLFSILFKQGIQEVVSNINYDSRTPILQVPNWIFTMAFPVGSALYIFRVVQNMVFAFRRCDDGC